MSYFSFFVFLSYVYITFVFIQQSTSDITNNEKKTKSSGSFSFLDKISSINGQIEDNVNELRCPEKWLQLGYSCYLLSEYISTAIQANHTCDLLHLDNSRLIFIQQSVELLYAAHVLVKNNLDSLMIEINQDLMKDNLNRLKINHIQWEEFGKKMLQDKLKESTTIANDENNDQNVSKPCDEIKWNIIDKNSNILILTVKMDSDRSICSLSNANIKAAYSHLCQYVLDRCLYNIMCGKYGRCVNSLSGFNCSCSFLYDGLFCDKFSIKDIQFLIALPVLLLSSLLLITSIQDSFLRAFARLFHYFRRRRQLPTQSVKNILFRQVSHETPTDFVLLPKEQRNRFVLVFIVSIIFSLILIGVPVICYSISVEMNKTNSSKFESLYNDNIHKNGQYRHNTIFRIENWICLIISIILSIIFSFLNVQNQSNDNNQLSILEPIKSFYITDRYKTVAIITIQMFEILKIIDETLIDISEASQSGIFVKIFTRMFFVIINIFRYYPILISLQFQDIKVRSLTFVYIISITISMSIHDTYWLSFFKNISLLERTNLHMNMDFWSFVYSLAKTCLYWILIGYICAELTMRLFYDSMYIALKHGRKITDKTCRKIEQYAFSEENMEKRCSKKSNERVTTGGNNVARSDHLQEQGCWFSMKKCIRDKFHQFRIYITDIFKYDDTFRFTTIVIVIYTISFIFLFHLTINLIFLYTTEKTNYIIYLKQIIERLLNIKIQEHQSFKGEVIISAIITMIIYGLQFLHSIKNYRDNVTNLYNIYSARRTPPGKPNDHEIIPKSIQYPAYILQYLLGGVVICFNLILFILIIVKIIGTQFTSYRWTLISIISVIIVYALHKMINRIINTFFASYNLQEGQNNVQLNRPYSILLYFNLISTSFIGIISSIIRLITSVLVNILFLPRIDYSCFVQPLQTLDSAHMAFQCFIHWEFLYTRDILFRLSATTQPTSNPDIPIHESTAEQQIVQEEHLEHQNLDENNSYVVTEIRSDNDHIDDSISTESNELNVLFEGRPLLHRS